MHNRLILIVDDDTDISSSLKDRLIFEGYDVETAENGEEGFNKANQLKPALILLDVMMPGESGFTTCSRLKENKKTKDIPVIMCTAKSLVQDVETGVYAGAESYITKPYDIESVLKKVNAHINK